MKTRRPLLALLLLALVATAGGAIHLLGTGSRFLLGGIMVNEPDHDAWARAIDESGMNAVSVTAYAHQGDWDSANLWFDDGDPAVVSEIRAARRRGLGAVLVLRVALDHAFERNAFLWHGMIQPAHDDDVEEWFVRYRAFVLQWAEIARDEGVAVLAVGSELNALASTRRVDEIPPLEEYYLDEEKQEELRASLLGHRTTLDPGDLDASGEYAAGSLAEAIDSRMAAHRSWAGQVAFIDSPDPVVEINRRRALLQGHWSRLIREVRAVFPGRLTFAANFDQYREVGFWDRLDLLGINAYFKLRSTWRQDADAWSLLPDLLAGWRDVLGQIDDFRDSIGRPGMQVIFTELGYTRRANSTFEPWAAGGASVVSDGEGERLVVWNQQPDDPGERALAVRALRRAEREVEPPLLAGILYWKLSTLPEHAEIEPFVLLVSPGGGDPLLAELRAFRKPRELDGWRRRILAWLGIPPAVPDPPPP